MEFSDSINKWFYQMGSNEEVDFTGTHVCLLNASGNPVGTKTRLLDLAAYKQRQLFSLQDDAFADLGLPSGTLWATKNLGATAEYDYGWYFSWGNMEGHEFGDEYNFNENNYNTTDGSKIKTDLTLDRDVVHSYFGGVCRMPTKADFEELINPEYTTIQVGQLSSIDGVFVTSNTNNVQIFLPKAGYISTKSRRSIYTYYLTSSLDKSYNALDYSYVFAHNHGEPEIVSMRRPYGYPIRPVL